MSDDRYGHGMKKRTCPVCQGRGEVVVPKTVVRDDGSFDTWEAAETCPICGGEKEVWV